MVAPPMGDRGGAMPRARDQGADFCCWKAKYGRMESGDLKKMKQLEGLFGLRPMPIRTWLRFLP